MDGVDEIMGHVEVTKRDNPFWYEKLCLTNVFSAAGTATFNGVPSYFIFLHADQGVWIIVSDEHYQESWDAEGQYLGSERVAQVLSAPWASFCGVEDLLFEFDLKEIH